MNARFTFFAKPSGSSAAPVMRAGIQSEYDSLEEAREMAFVTAGLSTINADTLIIDFDDGTEERWSRDGAAWKKAGG